MPSTSQAETATTARFSIRPYVQIARPDHWFKNAFMLLGIILAFFYQPSLLTLEVIPKLVLAVACTCIVASSNYVLNEWLDAPLDRLHPVKKNRPAALGLVSGPAAITEWLLLGAIGVGLSFTLSPYFGGSALFLWIMGFLYNVRPVRLKDRAYMDVVSESVNNPIRLLLGWYALIPDLLPPVSLLLAYWMAGAFFMATKRFAEYRRIDDPAVAASYRSSFRHYDESRLLVSMMFYVTTCALFAGIFIVRYKLELILCVPVVAGFFAYYMKLGLQEDSPVQNPEKLYREAGFFAYAIFTTVVFVLLMVISIPGLYELFNVEPATFEPLWTLPG